MALLPAKASSRLLPSSTWRCTAPGRPVSAKALAARHALPPRHLEPVLQALVREGILKGIRGPRGGYELAREARRITADDILRAAGTVDDAGDRQPRRLRRCSTRWCCRRSPRPNSDFGVALEPHQSRRPGAQRRAAAARHSAASPPRGLEPGPIARVHDLDSFGAIPLEGKVEQFAGLVRRDDPLAMRRWQPAEAKGHAGHDPDRAAAALIRGDADSRPPLPARSRLACQRRAKAGSRAARARGQRPRQHRPARNRRAGR